MAFNEHAPASADLPSAVVDFGAPPGLTPDAEAHTRSPLRRDPVHEVTLPRTPQKDFTCQRASSNAWRQPAVRGGSQEMTAMIRNIACRLLEDDVRVALDSFGLAGTYDEVYVPKNGSGRANLGYCFVNFKYQEGFLLCARSLTGRPLADSESSKTCEVSVAAEHGAKKLAKARKKGERRCKKPETELAGL